MRRLLVRQEDRLGLAAIKAHPFFAGVDWKNIRKQEAPFVPRISSPDDTSNFSVGDEAEEDIGMAMARASSSRLGHGREYAGEQLPFIGFTYLPPALALAGKRVAPATPRGPRDDPSQVRIMRAKLEQMEAAAASAEAQWAGQQEKWDDERRRLVDERRMLEDKVAALEAQMMEPPSRSFTPPPARTRDSAMQTEAEAEPAVTEPEVTDRGVHVSESEAANPLPPDEKIEASAQVGSVMADAYQKLTAQVVGSMEEQFGGQAEHLGKLVSAVNALAAATGERIEEGLQMQKKELAQLTHLVQSTLQPPATATTVVGSPPTATNNSPRLSSVASLSQAYQAVGGSPARLSIGSTHTARNSRRSISAVDDAALDSHPKSVVATLVNEMSKNVTNGDSSSSPGSGRRSLAPAGSVGRVARAERRVSTGVASDALSVIGNKCDRLAALCEQQAVEIGSIHQSQASLLAVCNALKLALEAKGEPAVPEDAGSESLRRSRRKTEQLRRRAADPFSSVASRDSAPGAENTRALELLKAATDELVASLRT
ncbi:Serine/threonine-protein kinase MRCK beta, partial [Coemansia sp. RSA 2618]